MTLRSCVDTPNELLSDLRAPAARMGRAACEDSRSEIFSRKRFKRDFENRDRSGPQEMAISRKSSSPASGNILSAAHPLSERSRIPKIDLPQWDEVKFTSGS